MTRVRSPGYPSISLGKALEITAKLYAANRTNGIDRDAAVRDMGYSGITGASGKMLANLVHYGLVEKAGKGGVRVTSLAVDILHPENESTRRAALHSAAFQPDLFSELRSKFPGGAASENAIRSYLMRQGFSDVAVDPAISSFVETCRLTQQEGAYESQGDPPLVVVESAPDVLDDGAIQMRPLTVQPTQERAQAPVHTAVPSAANTTTPAGSRVVFSEESSPNESLQVVARGEVTDALLEALEDYVKRQRKRLTRTN